MFHHPLTTGISRHTKVVGTPSITAHSALYAVAIEPRSQKNPSGASAAFGVRLAALGTINEESRTEVERH